MVSYINLEEILLISFINRFSIAESILKTCVLKSS